jgi:hypothetical protein
MDCKNCATVLSNTSQFCNNCGGKVIRNRLTIKNLFEHITQTFFNYDNKLLRTLVDLFIRPEAVIGGYIAGIRMRYVNPISYIALSLTLSGLYILVLNKYFPNAFTEMSTFGLEKQQATNITTVNIIQEYYSVVAILSIPLYAVMARLVFINKKQFNLTEHVVMAMYIAAQIGLVSAFLNLVLLLFIPGNSLGIASIFMQMAYFGYCYKRIYKLSFGGIMLRTLFFFVITFAIMIGFVILGILFALLFKDTPVVQQFIEQQNATIETQKAIRDSLPN